MNLFVKEIKKLISFFIVLGVIFYPFNLSFAEGNDDDFTVIYTVKPGDDVFRISKKFNINYHRIMQLNNLKKPYLQIGKQLLLEIVLIPESEKVIYTIIPHDNIYKIADRFNIDFNNIMTQNNLKNPYLVYIGQKLVLENKKKNKPLQQKKVSKYTLLPSRVSYTEYIAKPGDDLYKIAGIYNKTYTEIAKLNKTNTNVLKPGQKVIVNKEIIPSSYFSGIIINIPEQKLYLFSNNKYVKSYEIASGLSEKRWQTPTGDFRIIQKKDLPSSKDSKDQIFGKWWIGFSKKSGIHYASNPVSINYSVTNGCVRMYSRAAEDLFNRVTPNTPVKIIYQPVKVTIDENNKVFIEAYEDIYNKSPDYLKITKEIFLENKISDKIDWDIVSKVVTNRRGIKVSVN